MLALKLDHLAVAGATRNEARAHIEDALGVALQSGGAHALFGTHNHLLGLNNGLYLEAISIDPEAEKPKRARWFNLDRFSGPPKLSNWICEVSNMELAAQSWPQAGEPVALERGDLRWQMAVPRDGILPFDNVFPALISWSGALHPALMLEPSGVDLHMLSICHPDAELLQQTLCGAVSANERARLRFEIASVPALIAEFDTPQGRRILT